MMIMICVVTVVVAVIICSIIGTLHLQKCRCASSLRIAAACLVDDVNRVPVVFTVDQVVVFVVSLVVGW